MPVLTQGHLNLFSFVVRTAADLAAMRDASQSERYESPPSTGWGSLSDGHEELLGRPSRSRFKIGTGSITQGRGDYPERLEARIYFDQLDKRLMEVSASDDDPTRYYRFDACDVLIAPTAQEEHYLVIVSTRNLTQLRNYVLPAISRMIHSVDERAQIMLDSSPLSMDDDDIFRWFLYRASADPDLSADLMLASVDSISGIDVRLRPSALSQGAELDRPELLTLVARSDTRFGPAKISVWDQTLQLAIALELRHDGGFSVLRGKSEYEEDEESLSTAEEGMRLVEDATYRIIPELKRLYNADHHWRAAGRTAFIQTARDTLREITYS